MNYREIPWPEVVVLVRHGESEGNLHAPEARVQLKCGTINYQLTDRGKRQVTLTGEWLREFLPNPGRIIRSYYGRVRETADLLYPDLRKREDPFLAERDRGEWTVLTRADLERVAPWELSRAERDGVYHYRPRGGESMTDVEGRVREFRRSLRLNYSGKRVVIVGHAHWIVMWQKLVHDFTISETIRRLNDDKIIENASALIYRDSVIPETGEHKLVHDPQKDYVVPWMGQL